VFAIDVMQKIEGGIIPFKSESQRKAMNAKASRGEISKKVINEFNSASKGLKLPQKIKKKKG
jgi:hypothetical protein